MLNKLHGQPESYDKKYVTDGLCLKICSDLLLGRNTASVEPLAQGHMALSERLIAQWARLQ